MQRKDIQKFSVIFISAVMLAGCGAQTDSNTVQTEPDTLQTDSSTVQTDSSTVQTDISEGTQIVLSDDGIKVNQADCATDSNEAVYVGADIIYYEAGQGDTYGEGDESEEHTAEEAEKHTVVTITKPGTYTVSGKLSNGQLAIDLGEDAKEDENAVVNLILNQTDITCDVAPAIMVYNVYECGSDDVDSATKDVDTTKAGFNLIIADGSENTITGSHVAKIYKEGTTAEEIENDTAKKAHKYDAAIESQQSFNISAGETGDGKLTVYADNEGIETKLHLTINGGNIVVNANDDSINAGEDGVSVITFNGGIVTCDSGAGDGDEGDGIDSNGWIVVNDGYIIACANAKSQDSGVDSDNGVYINGGTVLASGHMYDEIAEDSAQRFMVLSFNKDVTEAETVLISDIDGNAVSAFKAVNDYNIIVYSCPELKDGDYNLYKVSSVTGDLNGSIYTNITDYQDAVQLQYTSNTIRGFGGGMPGANGERPEMPDGEMPDFKDGERPEFPEGEAPADLGQNQKDDRVKPDGEMPKMENGEIPQFPEDMTQTDTNAEGKTVYTLSADSHQFSGISEVSN